MLKPIVITLLLLCFSYTLQAADCSVTQIALNTAVNGTIEANDCTVKDLFGGTDTSRLDQYEFSLSASTEVTIDLIETAPDTDYDPRVFVYSTDLKTLHGSNDDSGSGFDAKLVITLSAGTYRVHANHSTIAEVTGSYSLTVGAVITNSRLSNISTRGKVGTDDKVMIGGLIIKGTEAKQVVIRARGPSLADHGVPNVLTDTTMQLFDVDGLIDSNDDWNSHANASQIPSKLQPSRQLEAAIFTTLQPGSYTAIVRGANTSTGVGIVEIFEVEATGSKLINISTRGPVGTGDDVMIGGLIITGDTAKTVVIRARGPSMPSTIPDRLQDPTFRLMSGQTVLDTNDNWADHTRSGEIPDKLKPVNANEAAILVTLNPGNYTAIVSGVGNTTGVALFEVFEVE